MRPSDFAKRLTDFLSVFLPGQQGVSVNTIKSYRDTFALFLSFCRDMKNMKIEKFTLSQFKRALVEEFLLWLETDRGNSISTRNQRLSAIHAFARYLQTEDTSHIAEWQLILGIGFKKFAKPQIGYLTPEELTEIFAKPDLKTSVGRRDLVLLNMLYDTGARVSELIHLKVRDIRLGEPPVATLLGKGNKYRQVPLLPKTVELLRYYLEENRLTSQTSLDCPLFFNSQHKHLTRPGITYILQKYTKGRDVTPHILRHTKAMHLLQAGVNIVYIRDILGHVDISTTEVYARADTEMKRKALSQVYRDLTPAATPSWQDDKGLMDWLHNFV